MQLTVLTFCSYIHSSILSVCSSLKTAATECQMRLDLHVNVSLCRTHPDYSFYHSFIPALFSCCLFLFLSFYQQMNCLCGDLESVAEVIGPRQGRVCLKRQGAECQSGLFSFQPRHLKNFKGGRDSRRGRLTQTEELCFPSPCKITLNL